MPMYDVRCTMYDCDVRARCAGAAEQVQTRVDEAVRGVWCRFRGCLCCWIVLQSGRARQGEVPGGRHQEINNMLTPTNTKLTELVLFLAENAELIEKAIYLLFVMLN